MTDFPGNEHRTWHALPVSEVLVALDSRAEGLATAQARHRLSACGPNEISASAGVSPWRLLLAQFRSLIVWILVVAAVVSGMLGEAVDAFAILAIVVLNAAMGFYQEYNAEKSIAALRRMAAPQAKVLRDGRVTAVAAAKVVPGDVLALEAGDLVAADARLFASTAFSCVESALTGESDAVDKDARAACACETLLADRLNMIFMGTSVATGTARAVVTATGMGTELGRIAQLIETGEEDTPLQKKLDAFGRVLIWATLGIVALLFLLGYLRGSAPFELFLGAVSLAVAAVPEGLPAVVTVALALGVSRMARRRALVRSLPAVETLGSTTVICTDKTGTLTAGEMTVRALYAAGQAFEVTGEGYAPDGEVLAGGGAPDDRQREVLLELSSVLLGCNNARLAEKDGTWSAVGDPTEAAMLAAGAKAGGDPDGFDAAMPRVHEIPFDSDRKLSTVVRRMPDGTARALVNGAPDVLLERCTRILAPEGVRPMTDGDRRNIAAQNAAMAGQALRVLGSARRDLDEADLSGALARDCAVPASRPSRTSPQTPNPIEQDLTFIGLCGMYDPPRPEAGEAVARCRAAGIRVVMITGDHPHTAAAIARELGISAEGQAVSGAELNAMSDGELARRVTGIDVYARVTAEHKLRVIRAWKEGGAVVAMTGDGVNDAPAVKGADIGIAMGRSGTEVTRQASDMVITDDNFATIVDAVEEGRGIFDNIRKTLQYLLAGNTGELLLMAFCVIIGLPVPLLPIHLLWINLVTDGLPALCLATDPIDPEVMQRRPRSRTEGITDGSFLGGMFLTGVLTASAAFAAYLLALHGGSVETARSWAFTVLVVAELLRSFGARSATRPVWRMSLTANMRLVLVVALTLGVQVLSQHNEVLGRFLKTVHIPAADAVLLFALGAIPLLALEGLKVMGRVFSERGMKS
ncbi:Ca2+-transporting ATPase [Desulfomicrobium macestii]|uniref:Ca2+-transporting ATPase n=1 Tax=Desulfomicrobium macestii TaxID=90731 RepID=A0ABR9GZ61_9BACT|nr:cation-translocating P-type ATPase [Desulfomicrobium macestii]MBE1423598.1 Ca2+-transporting ATPase [Desulfomicrobium macestii]